MSSFRRFSESVPLVPKMTLITVILGIVVWAAIDYLQSDYNKKLFDTYMTGQLVRQSQRARMRFDTHVAKYHQAIRLVASQKNLYDYVSAPAFSSHAAGITRQYTEIPPWLPNSSIMRHFVPITYAILGNKSGKTVDIYFGDSPDAFPQSLLMLPDITASMSHGQSFMTNIDNLPFLLTSTIIDDARGRMLATLLFAIPLDSNFMSAAEGAQSNIITTLVETGSHTLTASSRPDLLPPGSLLKSIEKDYVITGKSFFDQGSSDLTLEFFTLIPRKEFDALGASLLWTERVQRAVTAAVIIGCLTAIMFWITRHIRGLTMELVGFSDEFLGTKTSELLKGDELIILEKRFGRLTKEIMEAREFIKRQSEMLLREKTVYLASIMQSSPLAIAATDLDFRIKYYNPAAERFFGYTAEEVIGKTVLEIHIKERVDPSRFEKAIEIVKRDNLYMYNVESKTRQGTRFLESRVSGIWDKTGELVGFVLMSSDITERVKAEKEIKALAKFPDENPNPVLRISSDGIILYANEVSSPIRAFWGCGPAGKVPDNLIQLIHNALKSGVNTEIELSTGTHTFLLNIVPFPESNYLNIYGKDITELRRKERRIVTQHAVTRILSESATISEATPRLLREICESIGWEFGEMWLVAKRSEVLIWFDCWHAPELDSEEFEMCSFNTNFSKGVGLPGRVWADEKPVWITDVVRDANFPRAAIALKSGLHGALAFPVRIANIVTGVMAFFSRTVQQPDDELLRMFDSLGSQIGDFIERKRTEENLIRISMAVENSSDAIAMAEPGKKHFYQNAAFSNLFEYTVDELNAAGGPIVTFANQDLAAEIFQTIASGNPWTGETEMISKNGRSFTCLLRANAIMDVKGKIIGLIGVFTDITERKMAENKLKEYSAEIERSNHELELFASIASHDLQEPLRVVSGFAQLLSKRYTGKLDAEADEFISYITDGAGRMQQLIKDLLDYSRITTKGKPFVPVDYGNVLQSSLLNLKMAIEESSALVTYDTLPTLMGDESQLIRLFQNLIGNALKYRSERKPAIHVAAKEEGGDWLFSVSDNGIGMDSRHYERIFLIFQRLHKREEYPGTGIGLAISKKIVERHGGKIWVESEPGKGSVFYFTIPAIS